MHVQVLNRWKDGPYTLFFRFFYTQYFIWEGMCVKNSISTKFVVGIMQNFNFDVHVLLLFFIYTSKFYVTKCAPPPCLLSEHPSFI